MKTYLNRHHQVKTHSKQKVVILTIHQIKDINDNDTRIDHEILIKTFSLIKNKLMLLQVSGVI
jgi:type IV secretory pathway component VirB8